MSKQKNVVIARCGFRRGDPLGECFVYLKSLDTKWIASSQAPRNDAVVSLVLGREICFDFYFVTTLMTMLFLCRKTA